MIASPAFATCSTRTLVAAGPRARWTGADRPAVLPCRGKVRFHAPARGATRTCCPAAAIACSFNPRPRAGGDPDGNDIFTPRREGFNPRPRAGGDATRLQCTPQAVHDVSIHAPARGATAVQKPCYRRRKVSIHAPARGATSKPRVNISQFTFQSTPPRGGRLRQRNSLQASSKPTGWREPCQTMRRQIVVSRTCGNSCSSAGGIKRPSVRERARRAVSTPPSRTLKAPAGRQDRRMLSRLHVRFVSASWHRACRSAGCPHSRQSR